MKTFAAGVRGVIWLLVGAIGVVGIWLAIQIWLAFDYDLRGRIFGPDHSATIQTPNGARVKATMVVSSPIGRSEHQRKLEIQHGDRRLRVDLVDDWGPAARLSVYQTDQNGIAILGAAFEEVFFNLDPLQQTSQPNNQDSGRWTYLGAFDLRHSGDNESKTLVFNGDPFAECIPILMGGEPGGPYRTAFYQQSC